ncbi:MAG: SIS domain-containing protein [Patescibacteria group bacterium]
MNNIEKMRKDSASIGDFFKSYFSYVGGLYKELDQNQVQSFMEALEEARHLGKTVFTAGNGGSASTASHIGTDFCFSMFKGQDHTMPFRTYPLTDVSAITAAGNDFGYDQVFTKQLEVQYRDGDILMVISASGSSPNVVKAAEWVRRRGGKVLGLLGFDGGSLKDICNVSIVVKTEKGEYGPVEDVHLMLNHMFTAWMHGTFSDGK